MLHLSQWKAQKYQRVGILANYIVQFSTHYWGCAIYQCVGNMLRRIIQSVQERAHANANSSTNFLARLRATVDDCVRLVSSDSVNPDPISRPLTTEWRQAFELNRYAIRIGWNSNALLFLFSWLVSNVKPVYTGWNSNALLLIATRYYF